MCENKNTVIYTNFMEAAMTQFDLILNVGFRSPDNDINEHLKLVMSPAHMKKLHGMLSEAVNNYESLFGTIHIEPNPEALQKMQEQGEIEVLGDL